MAYRSVLIIAAVLGWLPTIFSARNISNSSLCFRDKSLEGGVGTLMMIPLMSQGNYTHAILDTHANIHLFQGVNEKEILAFPDGTFDEAGNVIETLLREPPSVDMVQAGPEKDIIAVSFSNGTYNVVYIWNLTTLRMKTKFKRHESKIVSITYLQIYDKIASVSDKGVIYLWEHNRGHIWRQFKLNSATYKIIGLGDRSILAVIVEKPALGFALDVYAIHTTMDFDLMVSHLLIPDQVPDSLIYLKESDYLMLAYKNLNSLWIFGVYDKTSFQVQLPKLNTGFYKSGIAYDPKKGFVYALGRDKHLYILERFNTTFLEKSSFPEFEDKIPVGYLSLGDSSRLFILHSSGFTSFQKDKTHLLLEKTCVLYCPDGYYSNIKECAKCHFTCGRCKGPSFDDCLNCGISPTDEYKYFMHSTCVNACPANSELNRNHKNCECKRGFFYVQGKCESLTDLSSGKKVLNESLDFEFLEGRKQAQNKTSQATRKEEVVVSHEESGSVLTIIVLTLGIPLALLMIVLIMILLYIHFEKMNNQKALLNQEIPDFAKDQDFSKIDLSKNYDNFPIQNNGNNLDNSYNNSMNNLYSLLENKKMRSEGFDLSVNNEPTSFLSRDSADTNRPTKENTMGKFHN